MADICALVKCLLICVSVQDLYDIRHDLDMCVELRASVDVGNMGGLDWAQVPARVSHVKVWTAFFHYLEHHTVFRVKFLMMY